MFGAGLFYFMTEKEKLKSMVREAVVKLSEHCDSIRIIVTKQCVDGETDSTTLIDNGSGNFYAQLASVREWLVIQEQYQRNLAIKKDEENE